jgi:hypothetical protein
MTKTVHAPASPFGSSVSPPCAYNVVSLVTMWGPVLRVNPADLNTRSLSSGRLTSLLIVEAEPSVSHSTFEVPALIPTPHMESTPACCMATMVIRPWLAPATELLDILYKVVSPYQPFAWQQALLKAKIHILYSNLVHDLTYGSPISNPLRLERTFILANLPSAKLNPTYVLQSLLNEVASGCMDGPFSIADAHRVFNGHFCTSPLSLVEKTSSTTEFRLIRHLSKADEAGHSTNGWLDARDFPTHYSSAAQCADLVSPLLPFLSSSVGWVGYHAPIAPVLAVMRSVAHLGLAVMHPMFQYWLSCVLWWVGCYAPTLFDSGWLPCPQRSAAMHLICWWAAEPATIDRGGHCAPC